VLIGCSTHFNHLLLSLEEKHPSMSPALKAALSCHIFVLFTAKRPVFFPFAPFADF
jgi:hypothetical protein